MKFKQNCSCFKHFLKVSIFLQKNKNSQNEWYFIQFFVKILS